MTKNYRDLGYDAFFEKPLIPSGGRAKMSPLDVRGGIPSGTITPEKNTSESNTFVIPFIIDGGGSVITTGEKGHLEIPFSCKILRVTSVADQSGSIVVDIWKDIYANLLPTNADSITSATPPTITTAIKAQDDTLSDWTVIIDKDDFLAYNVDSVTTITRVLVSLKCKRL